MNSLNSVCIVLLIAAVVVSCGVLESSPSATLAEPSTSVVTPGVRLVGTAAGDDGSKLASSDSLNAFVVGNPIFRTDRCNRLSRGGFIWFTDQLVLDDWLSPLEPAIADEVRSKIDFIQQGALLLDYGIAGSKGSGATLLGELEIDGQDGVVTIKQFKAPANKKTAQVVTHPCSLFVLPRLGFSKLVVVSDLGDQLTSFDNQ